MSDILSRVNTNVSMTPRWYLVHAQPHRESRAAANLRRQGFRTFLPLHRKTVRHARQFREVLAPFFPRYLFVELTIGRDRWRSVNGTFGVSRLIVQGDWPEPVPTGVVEELAASTNAAGLLSLHPSVRPGQKVRIVTGPFSGLVGRLAALDQGGRVKVLLDIMGKQTQVSVAASGVGLVPAV